MKPTESELIEELLEIEEIQARIDRVAGDLESGKNRYAAIYGWKLGELLGLDWMDTADWGRSYWAYKVNLGDQDYDYPYAENISLLKKRIPSKRFKELVSEAEGVLRVEGGPDLSLTGREEQL
ncbi:hypothetical protein N8766_06395, partial [bacterium]|nr:hypothetical protein [bacterium]